MTAYDKSQVCTHGQTPAATAPDEILTPAEVAARLRMSRSQLYAWRAEGYGPPSFLLGRKRIGYLASAVEEWLKERSDEAKRGQA